MGRTDSFTGLDRVSSQPVLCMLEQASRSAKAPSTHPLAYAQPSGFVAPMQGTMADSLSEVRPARDKPCSITRTSHSGSLTRACGPGFRCRRADTEDTPPVGEQIQASQVRGCLFACAAPAANGCGSWDSSEKSWNTLVRASVTNISGGSRAKRTDALWTMMIDTKDGTELG